MSDEAGASTRKDTLMYEHSCEHPGCKKWAVSALLSEERSLSGSARIIDPSGS